ncbi:MAG: phosphoribosyltransferase [Bacteroidetes bacterium]|jgi:pyrimidine operon attenuation protein/uracil phosphoribosyltransferase|nr:phosphoribosyltransferase [Bacteroidota bacterium]
MAIQILQHADSEAKLTRMAWQLYEWAYGQPELVLVGIDERGGYLADLLAGQLRQISQLQLQVYYLPRGGQLHMPHTAGQKPMVLVDDVHYSGTTLMHALQEAARYQPSQLQVAVLIDRGHHLYPVHARFVGLELATTLQEYITVRIQDGQIEAFLD